MNKLKNNKPLIKIVAIGIFVLTLFLLPFFFRTSSEEPLKAAKENKSEAGACDIVIRVNGQKEPIPLEEYIVGVVAAEMPATFHPEALKAQAIAARTYVLKTTNNGQLAIEPTVMKQVFYDEDQRKENWQATFEQNEQKIRDAVKSTEGEVIKYNGELITAMFHSMSNGMTESAKNYNGSDLPYLQSVVSTDFHAENFVTTKNFSLADLNRLLKVNMTLDDIKKIKIIRNDTGRVEKIVLGDKEWLGRDIRTKLELRSTDFDIKVVNNEIAITTEGYGHGVGMSQYGADVMAKQGNTAHDILNHYYTGITIEKMLCKK